MKKIFLIIVFATRLVDASSNQTSDISNVLVNQDLPFTISIEQADYTLPIGIQSFASAQSGANYLFIAGRMNGLHGFDSVGNDFPPDQQNTNVVVLNVSTQKTYMRSLYDPLAGLTQAQIDTLSATSPQYYQSGNRLYITGGYGIDTASSTFSTKDTLTAIDVPGLIDWVVNPQTNQLAKSYIRQISNPVFQVTGGAMFQFNQDPTLLIFGQNFIGTYTSSSNGIYTKQVRRFNIIDDGKTLGVVVQPATGQQEAYRRRDLNVVPIIKINSRTGKKVPAWVALSGVFTENGGIWTVPVEIATNGSTLMANPALASTFKQGMNNYVCPRLGLLAGNGDNYTVLFGGLTFEYFQAGSFDTDAEIPFTNNVTAIKYSQNGQYQQYLLPCEYPTILSTFSNPGNILLFGAGGVLMLAPNLPIYSNNVLDLTKLKAPTVVGYIVGGIQSTEANTSSRADSAASPYIFKVVLSPR